MAAAPPIPHLDLITMRVISTITMLVVGMAMSLAWNTIRRVDGMQQFTVGIVVIGIGSATQLARAVISGNAIIFTGNALMVGGLLALIQGIRKFRRFPQLSRMVATAILVVIGAPYCYWLFRVDSFNMRVGVVSAAFALGSLDAGLSMLRRVAPKDRWVYWPTGISFVVFGSYHAVRAFGGFFGQYGPPVLTPLPLEIATAIFGNAAYILCSFGMVVAYNTSLRNDAETMALRDSLTGLPNRRQFMDRLMEAEIRAIERNTQFGLIYFDLDGFKQVNDVLGHDVGDELLKTVSAAMTRTLRSRDYVGRLGGDEFVVLVEGVGDRREVVDLADRLTLAVEGERIPGHEARARISWGVAIFPDDGASAHDVMREADTAMYVAKQRGRTEASGARRR